MQAAGQALRKASSLGSDILKRGRNQLQLEVLSEVPSLVSSDLASQVLLNGSVKKATEVADEIAKLSDSDILNVRLI